jgi:hypothetical protein
MRSLITGCEGLAAALDDMTSRGCGLDLTQRTAGLLMHDMRQLRRETGNAFPSFDGVTFEIRGEQGGFFFAPKPEGLHFNVRAMPLGTLQYFLGREEFGKHWEQYIAVLPNPYLANGLRTFIQRKPEPAWQL